MRTLLAALAMCAAGAASPAQSPSPPPAAKPDSIYAVVSLVGDRLLILNHAMRTGSHLERNERMLLELNDTALNDMLADAVYDALEARLPDARVTIATLRDPALWAAHNRLVEGGASTQELLVAMAPYLDRLPAARLVLVTKVRHDALFEVDGSHVGGGKAEGIGFYVDRYMGMRREGYTDQVRGFLGAFAYFRVSLIDLRTRKVLREQVAAGSLARWPKGPGSDHPWDTMSAAEKVEALKKLMHDEAMRAVAQLVAN